MVIRGHVEKSKRAHSDPWPDEGTYSLSSLLSAGPGDYWQLNHLSWTVDTGSLYTMTDPAASHCRENADGKNTFPFNLLSKAVDKTAL